MGDEAVWVSKAFERDVATGIIITAAVVFVFMFASIAYAIRAVWKFTQVSSKQFLQQNAKLIDAVTKTGKELTETARRSIRMQRGVLKTLNRHEDKLNQIEDKISDIHDSVKVTQKDVQGLAASKARPTDLDREIRS